MMQEIQETWVPSLGWKDPLEEEMATRSSILAQKLMVPDKTEQARDDFLNSLLLVHFQASFLFLFFPLCFFFVFEQPYLMGKNWNKKLKSCYLMHISR